ncbi:family 43 glycosylhydrolase [Massilia sp. HP4]|uniref:family 43 glycosylhydrolase n=1 Tax=Massilia sp. HP4 TaxID=2562316 RepID=UPI001E5982F4|nr:family 43 glycosylhydrolase [Massilia sp. HP4]
MVLSGDGGRRHRRPGHRLVIAARSTSIHGPWEHCPHNPLVRSLSTAEPWWSRGHATLVEGPAGAWWMIYQGDENGYRTLGRQTLLEPVEWTDDGWFRALGGDLSRPLTTTTSSPGAIPAMAARAGPCTARGWRCPASTTMCSAVS